MTSVQLALAIAIVAIILVVTIRILTPGELSRLKVLPRPLMTRPERRVCSLIERALPGTRVHAQVSMGALMNPAKGLSKSDWWTTFNKFSSKRVDFVVEDPATGKIIVLIELDDRSHNRRNDKDRDTLTKHAGYRTVRLPAGERHTQASIKRRIDEVLGPPRPPISPPIREQHLT
ncbi:MAG: DUF2726 domain-containing protein [Pseudomonadota bacterium]